MAHRLNLSVSYMRMIPELSHASYFWYASPSSDSLASPSASSSARSSLISSASLSPPSRNPSTPCSVHPRRWSVTRSWNHKFLHVNKARSLSPNVACLYETCRFHRETALSWYLWEVVCSYLLISLSSADLFPSLLTPLLQSSPSLDLIKPCT